MRWIILSILAVAILIYLRAAVQFSRNRKSVVKQTGEKWYCYASKEIFTKRGEAFLREHFAILYEPERVRTESERPFAQTAALGVYLRLLEEKGEDPEKYDALPVEKDFVQQAGVLSRIAIRSWHYMDNVEINRRN